MVWIQAQGPWRVSTWLPTELDSPRRTGVLVLVYAKRVTCVYLMPPGIK